MAHGRAAPVGDGEGRDPGIAPAPRRAGRRGEDLRVRGAGGRGALAPAADDARQHGRRADADDQRLPERPGDARLPPPPAPEGRLGAPGGGRRRGVRRPDRAGSLHGRAARRAAGLARPRRARRGGGGHARRASDGGLVHERLLGGHVGGDRDPARPERPPLGLVRAVPRQPPHPRDDGARGAAGGPAGLGRARLGALVRGVRGHRPRAGRGGEEPARLQPQLPGTERREGRPGLPLLLGDGRGLGARRAHHRPARGRRHARALPAWELRRLDSRLRRARRPGRGHARTEHQTGPAG